MAQYTNSVTIKGVTTSTTLDTTTDTQTITVTLPTGQVATATQPGTTEGLLSTTTDQLVSQFQAQGVTTFDGPSVGRGVRSTATDVVNQSYAAQREATATNTSPPAEKQAIPVSTTSDAAVPQPQNVTANTVPNTDTATSPSPVPNQSAFPVAYDGNGNLLPGFELNENGDPVNVGTPTTTVFEPQNVGNNDNTPEVVITATRTPADTEDPFEVARQAREADYDINFGQDESAVLAANEAATRDRARQQQVLSARRSQGNNGDWRFKLQLSPNADYLYQTDTYGLLDPLKNKGVIFPYTPQIEMNYVANYEKYDLVHSNYRGYFYRNSNLNEISVRAPFTAQDTSEAQYLLAVIHFFRSVTKMFYGKDTQAGAPPPLVYASGFGPNQFNFHACLVSSFTYSLPNDVDYIRADSPNQIGVNLENRNNRSSALGAGGPLTSIINRLKNANLFSGAVPEIPNPSQIRQTVYNTNASNATYVPTKIEIALTLLPVQTRSQVSQQFSLQGFANGQLLKGGFW